MSFTGTAWLHLERDPKSSYRQLSIKGRRIKARTIYGMHVRQEDPQTPEQIAADLNLPLEAVREAVAYCRSDPADIKLDQLEEELSIELAGGNKHPYRCRPLAPEEISRIQGKVEAAHAALSR